MLGLLPKLFLNKSNIPITLHNHGFCPTFKISICFFKRYSSTYQSDLPRFWAADACIWCSSELATDLSSKTWSVFALNSPLLTFPDEPHPASSISSSAAMDFLEKNFEITEVNIDYNTNASQKNRGLYWNENYSEHRLFKVLSFITYRNTSIRAPSQRSIEKIEAPGPLIEAYMGR